MKLRVSVVEYLNTAPLVWGFTHGPLAGRYELQFAVPSQCAEALRTGAADIGIIPAIEYQRMDDVVMFPEVAVAARGAVRSILLLAKKPVEQARRFALDASSRSSQALVRILAKRLWRIEPEFFPAAPDPVQMLREADAALLIGDPALEVQVRLEESGEKKSRHEFVSAGKEKDWPVPGLPALHVYDVAEAWRELTGLPCVLAVWVARREAATPEVVADFLASKEHGLARLKEIAEWAAVQLALPAAALESYLRENIEFSLGADTCAGLELYFRCCAEDGLIPRAKPIEWAARAAASSGEERAGVGEGGAKVAARII